jgi:hypothetical protein
MPLSIDFPKLPDVPREVPLLASIRPRWTREAIADLSRQFRLDGEPRDAGAWSIVRDERGVLEIYQNSHSFRFERLDIDGEGRHGTVEGLSHEKAIDIANGFVAENAAREAGVGEPAVTELEVLVAERDSSEPRRLLAGLQISYRYTIEGFDLMGPGAKTQVTIGPDTQIAVAYRFWRDVRIVDSVATVAADAAAERFSASELFADLDDKGARCEITGVRFGYLTRPPTEAQGTILPAYEFRGVLSTEALPRYEFTNYVLGCELEEVDAKWAGRVGSLSQRLVG